MKSFCYLCKVQEEFESNIFKNTLFNKNQKLLLAISGGVDSVVLAHLLKNTGFNFSLAHCNFKLRGKESDEDEKLCKSLAKELDVTIYTKSFGTHKYSIENKTNIQLAARELRYKWFHQLVKQHGFDYILTGHHINDVIETIFINLLRGTGIKGLKGIPEKAGIIVRPLLNFKKEEIQLYATKNNISFRLDKSNLEDEYERNFIRLNVLTELKKIRPRLEEIFIRNTVHFREEAGIVESFLDGKASELITQTHDCIFIHKRKLKQEKYARSVLHHIISGYGFNETQEKNILQNINSSANTGKIFASKSHQLCIDRNDLVIKPISQNYFREVKITSLSELKKQTIITCSKVKTIGSPSKADLIINRNQLIFPLVIRQKLTGDKFKPFGMKGFKLVSDFLKDEKLNAFEKENCKLLVNGNGEIIWLVGKRSDERYKVSKTDTDLLKLTYSG